MGQNCFSSYSDQLGRGEVYCVYILSTHVFIPVTGRIFSPYHNNTCTFDIILYSFPINYSLANMSLKLVACVSSGISGPQSTLVASVDESMYRCPRIRLFRTVSINVIPVWVGRKEGRNMFNRQYANIKHIFIRHNSQATVAKSN